MAEKIPVVSPIPGVFYRRESPDKDVYVNEGDEVKEGDVIGLVEVMKNFHEVTSTESGVVVSFSVENEAIIEAGQKVAIIEPK
ncbi:acetyl-CoA carboxylase [Pseudalkalibacillus salsuginis]|uniref:acetyl-CoA carboxylase n=1 Tax=Pseudalkalibacillus salsuginis TaxID=2910972 RepID=UPI001EEBDF73|nr:acetyl-CoA carboxylase [Pseudalkalibacillus salsuginis]MCF6412025.1 biotin carboxyl carrier domain-containing protein [Pseudalkalibacillus salsuginis]